MNSITQFEKAVEAVIKGKISNYKKSKEISSEVYKVGTNYAIAISWETENDYNAAVSTIVDLLNSLYKFNFVTVYNNIHYEDKLCEIRVLYNIHYKSPTWN